LDNNLPQQPSFRASRTPAEAGGRHDTEPSLGSARATAKAGFQLAATLRYALAGMTILVFLNTNSAIACDVAQPFYTEEFTLYNVAKSDVAFEGMPISVRKISGRSEGSKGAIEIVFKVNLCVKGECGQKLNLISEDMSGLNDCQGDNTRIFKESLRSKKPLWVAVSFSSASSPFSKSFSKGNKVLYYGGWNDFAFEAHPSPTFSPNQ
jgi:hypothetical protein